MKRLRAYTIISLLSTSLSCVACWYPTPTPRDNMIYRLVEDVSSYYIYDSAPYFNPSNNSVSNEYFRTENIKLWRKQTNTTISDKEIERFVYLFSADELKAHKESCIKNLGEDAYEFLVYAKICEQTREEMNDPWYYPTKNDPLANILQEISDKGMDSQNKYFNRYVLLTIRALVAIHKDNAAVAFWEKAKPKMGNDIILTMAERHVAMAYNKIGYHSTARKIYARIGDLTSLYCCSDNHAQMWEEVFRENPNSPFFVDVMQSLLTHLDNRYFDKMTQDYGYKASWLKNDMEQLNTALKTAIRATKDHRVKDKAIWYYSAAALLDSKGDVSRALSYAKRGKVYCKKGSFMDNSMRVLRIYLEAQMCTYDSAYIVRLADDLAWLSSLAKSNITQKLKSELKTHTVIENWGGQVYRYSPDVFYTNKMYWSDAINRILADVLAPKLKRQGKAVDALLIANLGEFWLPRNATGKAHSPNNPGSDSFTDHSNAMAEMADTCSAKTIITMYKRLIHPWNVMDRLVKKNGIVDKDYWCDVIGTHCIAEHRYKDAVSWLKSSSASYQKNCSTWYLYDRDPFCLKIGWATDRRHIVRKKADYKLAFAKRMVELEYQMNHAKAGDKRAEAMVLYGVGLRNQSDWCWTLTRFGDYGCTHDDYVDSKRSQSMIDRGIASMKDKELKAYYLYAFARNKEVMDLCYDTKIAKKLQAHCDVWRNYKKNQ